MSWGTSDGTAVVDDIPRVSSPVWILGLAIFVAVTGFAIRLFTGLSGAYMAYALGLIAFTLILVFRRRNSVLSGGAIVLEPTGLDQILVVAFALTVVEVLFAVWPIATEISRW